MASECSVITSKSLKRVLAVGREGGPDHTDDNLEGHFLKEQLW
jgi:hypothetical protein